MINRKRRGIGEDAASQAPAEVGSSWASASTSDSSKQLQRLPLGISISISTLTRSVLVVVPTVTAVACVIYLATRPTGSRTERFGLSKFAIIRCLSLVPAVVCLYVGLVRRRRLQQPWYRSIIPLTLVVSVVCSQLPLAFAAALAAAAVTAFALVTRPHTGNNTPTTLSRASPTNVVLATALLVAVLLTENFMIWVVSATFPAGQSAATAPPPLQDNGRAVLATLLFNGLEKTQVVQLRRLWNVQWSLVACMGAAFVVTDVFLHPARQLYALGTRALVTLAAARMVRTASFCLTVLPSQVPHCYQQHYPYPPPTQWWDWIWVGLLPAAHGGCNDLILSGHATVTSTLACIATAVADDALFSGALWTMVLFDYAVEIYEGFHYSVDMWLGMVVVALFWRVMHPIERDRMSFGPMSSALVGDDIDNNDIRLVRPTIHDGVLYSIPAMLAYLQLVLFPKWTGNFLIVAYVLVAAVTLGLCQLNKEIHNNAVKEAAYRHYGQHIILCLLYMALGIYL
jgi:hypothetical protein